MHSYIAYADGACSGNPGPGGWAFHIAPQGGHGFSLEPREQSDGSVLTTNNIMELTAALRLFECIETCIAPCSIQIVLDSQYVLDGIFKWMDGWERNNWRTSSKKEVKNVELWKQVHQTFNKLKADGYWFEPTWVKGHSGNCGNERVDTLAQEQRDRFIAIKNCKSPAPIVGEGTSRSDIATVPVTSALQPAPAMAIKSDEITQDQVALMRTILDGFVDGSSSIKDVLNTLRKNHAELAIG